MRDCVGRLIGAVLIAGRTERHEKRTQWREELSLGSRKQIWDPGTNEEKNSRFGVLVE
jgi:hypothetical protein